MRKILRRSIRILLVVILVFGLGRGWYWMTGRADLSGLRGAAQVFTAAQTLAPRGGFSGLVMDPDGTRLVTSSDKGRIVTARLTRATNGAITRLDVTRDIPVMSHKGGVAEPFHSDLEGLTPLPGGALGLAFESYTRLQILPRGLLSGSNDTLPRITHGWNLFEAHFGNRAFEAIATLPANDQTTGDMLAILERKAAPDTAQAYLFHSIDGAKPHWRGPHALPAQPGWAVSGADVGPDGCLYLLERRYGALTGFQTQLIRLRGILPRLLI